MTTTSLPHALAERALRAVDDLREEIVALTVELVRIPTVNPPGEDYRDGALAIGGTLARCDFERRVHRGGRPPGAHPAAPARQRGRRARRHRARAARPPERPLRRGAGRRRAGPSTRSAGTVQGRQDLRPRRLRHEGRHRRGRVRRRGDPPRRRRAAGDRSRSAARWTRRAAASPASPGWREHRPHRAGPHRLRASSPSRSTSTASASAIAASTGSR